jgi:hypothetical protein
MKVLGYLEGTDPIVLTTVVLEGYETLPLSNGWDNHGKHLTLLNPADNIALVVGSLHKFVRLEDMSIFSAMLATVKAYGIPVIFIVPNDSHDKARKLITDKELKFKLVDPADLAEVVLADLKS